MKNSFLDIKIKTLFLIIAVAFTIAVVGFDNIFFKSVLWLHDANESAYNQLGWHFFKNDIWRFPFGSNPNYGGSFGSSIVYTDSVPFLAILFKLIKPAISGNFQYFSFWYLLCFYFQLFFSFKILKKFTNSDSYSLIGSLFFLIAPIFIYRVDYHAGLAGQWILLFTLYLSLTKKIDKSKFLWSFVLCLSSVIHFYFTMMILAAYGRIFNFYFEKENYLKVLKDFFIVLMPLLITLYLFGYFEIRMADSLGLGFGHMKLNLLSFFDPDLSHLNISWSWILPDIKLTELEEAEGFNYLGLGQIIMFFFTFIVFFTQRHNENLSSLRKNKKITAFLFLSLIFTLWALSNKISFGSYTLLEIPLNKYIFGLLSIAKSSGRVFWIVNYFFLILSLVLIYKCFKPKQAFLIISIFFIVQLADTSSGLKNKINQHTHSQENILLKNEIWDQLLKKNKILKTTYPISWSGFLKDFSYFMEKKNITQTNIVILVRMNRKAVAEARYNLYKVFREKKLETDVIYLVENLNHLRHLKYLFKDENVQFFYRDNFWIMAVDKANLVNDEDKKIFSKVEPKILEVNKIKELSLNSDSYYGLGWSHNLNKPGIWSEGLNSTLLFKTEKNYGDLKLEIILQPYTNEKNKILDFDIYVNNSLNKNVKLDPQNKNLNEEKIVIIINKKFIKNNEVKIDFNFKNLVSPYEVLESPDSRKIGILAKSIKITPI